MSPRLSIGDALVISGAVDILLSTCYLDILTVERRMWELGQGSTKLKRVNSHPLSPLHSQNTEQHSYIPGRGLESFSPKDLNRPTEETYGL